MSWSLALANGDFVLQGTNYSTVTDAGKLTQDLTCALLQPMGTDPYHVDYGSLIDGGTLPDGSTVTGVIGVSDLNHAANLVQAEVQRIAQWYQNQQLARAKADRVTYNRVSLTPGEVLVSVANAFEQQTDNLKVTVSLLTAAGDSLLVVFPLSTDS